MARLSPTFLEGANAGRTGPGLTLADTSLVTTELEGETVMVKLSNDEVGKWGCGCG